VPLYEYACMKCESHFEELVRGDDEPACPHCGAEDVRRQLSTFARGARVEAVVGATRPSGGGCCGGGCGCG
jgi:putative FmdB family regulatory protein